MVEPFHQRALPVQVGQVARSTKPRIRDSRTVPISGTSRYNVRPAFNSLAAGTAGGSSKRFAHTGIGQRRGQVGGRPTSGICSNRRKMKEPGGFEYAARPDFVDN